MGDGGAGMENISTSAAGGVYNTAGQVDPPETHGCTQLSPISSSQDTPTIRTCKLAAATATGPNRFRCGAPLHNDKQCTAGTEATRGPARPGPPFTSKQGPRATGTTVNSERLDR